MKKIFIIGLLNYWIIGLLFTGNAYAQIATAFGTFDATPGGFVSQVFRIILSLAGISALGLIIYGGFQLGLSQGNQEKTQQAKEILTSAIIGLLFVIFSTIILRIIGINVLGLGGIFQ